MNPEINMPPARQMANALLFATLDRSRTLGLAWLCAATLSACAVGPDYKTPTADAGQTFAHADNPEFSTQGVDAAWWKLFDDKDLTDLVDQTVRHNRDLQAARANLRVARALYMDAGLDLVPTVTSHANYTDQKRSAGALSNRAFAPRDLKLYNVGFDAFWEADFFGRVRR
ncbi:MAG: hypothetical protein Q7U28_07805, partial [Aquabacterium sp.]|nr:hypothetical protein [Aquabacterium sp.]